MIEENESRPAHHSLARRSASRFWLVAKNGACPMEILTVDYGDDETLPLAGEGEQRRGGSLATLRTLRGRGQRHPRPFAVDGVGDDGPRKSGPGSVLGPDHRPCQEETSPQLGVEPNPRPAESAAV